MVIETIGSLWLSYKYTYDNICVNKNKYIMPKVHDYTMYIVLYENTVRPVMSEDLHFTHIWKTLSIIITFHVDMFWWCGIFFLFHSL